jgi:hypothetical protein
MKNWKILLPAALLLSALWFACRDQDSDGYENESDVAFAGRVIDEAGQPIEGAQVRAGAELAISDKNGVFRTAPVSLPTRDAKLSITKFGYFDFSRAYIVEDNAIQTVTIQLLRKEWVGVFDGNAGGTVQVPGGVSLDFPAGAVAFSGEVYVFARYLDPTSPNLSLHMPGDLRGISTGGEDQTLATFGMLGVELTSLSGQPLQIASGSEVEISMPIPASQLSIAPASIPLWYYDHDKARWVEEGSAQKIGDQYVGKVKHFSFWNCDAGFPLVQLNGKVYLDNYELPLANATVRLTILSSGWQGYGWTDANGCFGGSIPLNEAMKLEILLTDQCGNQAIYSQDIGPFSADAILPPIFIANPQVQAVSIEGRLLDCSGQPVTNGYAKIEISGAVNAVFTNQAGEFELNFLNCNSNASGTVTAYDLTNLLESNPQNFNISSGTVNLGDIQTCNALSEYLQFDLDGQSRTHIDPSAVKEGNYTFVYASDSTSTGSTSISFSFTNSGQTGTYSLNYLNIWPPGDSTSVLNVTTIVTEYGNVGEPIVGTFSGTYQSLNGPNHTISGSYRVLREQ